MKQYLDLLQDVLKNGREKADRTGTGTRSVFGRQIRMNLADGFPLLTTKKVFFRGVVAELLWFLSGDTNEHTLRDQGVHIWREWIPKGPRIPLQQRVEMLVDSGNKEAQQELFELRDNADNPFDIPDGMYAYLCRKFDIPTHKEGSGNLGRVYGSQWRSWRYVKDYGPDHNWEIAELDQIANLICDLKVNPTSRRHIVTAWNPGEIDQMALPACHCFFQLYCEELTPDERLARRPEMTAGYYEEFGSDKPLYSAEARGADLLDGVGVPRYRLSCQLYQRSGDAFLGVPMNIASYSLLTMMIAQCVNMVPGEFVHTFGDLHIYSNHMNQVKEQLSREPRPLPRMKINPDVKDIFAFKMEDFSLIGYTPYPAIKAPVAV